MKWFQQTQIWDSIRFEIQVESRIRILSAKICHANLESESKKIRLSRISNLESESFKITNRIRISNPNLDFCEFPESKIRV